MLYLNNTVEKSNVAVAETQKWSFPIKNEGVCNRFGSVASCGENRNDVICDERGFEFNIVSTLCFCSWAEVQWHTWSRPRWMKTHCPLLAQTVVLAPDCPSARTRTHARSSPASWVSSMSLLKSCSPSLLWQRRVALMKLIILRQDIALRIFSRLFPHCTNVLAFFWLTDDEVNKMCVVSFLQVAL